MHSLALIGLVGCGLVANVILSIYKHLSSPLRSIPGPFIARFTNFWYLYQLRGGNFEVVNQRLHEKYGPIVRYGPNRYSFATLDAGKAIYGHGTSFPKSSWYNSWRDPGTGVWTLFTDRDVKRHAGNRRLFQNTYSMSSLVSYEPYVDECADLFSTRLTEMAQDGVKVNMGHWLQCYAFDVIGSITYSKRLGFLDQGDDVGGVINALENFLGYATLTGVYAHLHPYLFALKNYMAGSKGAGRAYVQNFTKECMVEHQTNPKALSTNDKTDFDHDETEDVSGKATDFLTKFFSRHTRDPDTFTTYHIAVGCAQNMVAGSDTTAISLSAIVYYLLKNPSCLQKLRDEISELQAEGKASEKYVTFKESQEMPYLQATIKEALRLHPAAGLPLERVVPEGGATISGRFFPEGSIVGINCWIEHRNSLIFGSDANEFRPERWLTEDSEKLAFMNRHWMPFGLGSRTCIGRHISMLEISKLIPRLVQTFDFRLSGDLARSDVSWSTDNYWFVKPKDFLVEAKLR
ncbi:cytochrome P450 [Truncatella angustata]|uniref:Cytochrome P450 n=1 Tax=Truncatella angustata TaxID=152316 RepID=A0A9P8ZXR6_9PEZI|nr:cytochrome P450 [Truncatella angustata]KAH6655206.1 cytochrome P450 [Truncatella angustata]